VADNDGARVPSEHQPNDEHRHSQAHRPGFVYLFGRALLGTIARVIYRPRVSGRGNVPTTGPVILASNHLAFLDSIVIPILAPRRVQFLAKSQYFDGTGIKGSLSRLFFTSIGAVGIERGAGQAAQEALNQGRAILESGNAFAVYPEGTRSKDGRLYKGRTGVAWLALTTGALVVPVGLIGTDKLQPAGTRIPRRYRVTVNFGEPLDLNRHGEASSGRARRLATDEIMAAIQKLSGQEEAGVYNEVPASGLERIKRAVLRPERF
jgi:1-acyl-sn-glycerol-3-phosphate acyltransferase